MDQAGGNGKVASATAAAQGTAQQAAAATNLRQNHHIATDILDDLSSRFIINVPAEERSDFIRICFQIELAHWFYLDFYCSAADTRLVPCGIKQFACHIFHHIPFLTEHLPRLSDIMTEFKNYKMSVPTYGAILMTADRQRVLLVQSFLAKSSWGFPKGKVNEHEDPLHCAVREVYEETGYNCQPLIRPDVYIECVLNYQFTRLYIVPDVPVTTAFAPRTRGEIKACTWFQLDLLPTHKMDPVCKERLGINANSFFMIMPFVKRLKRWVVGEQRAAGGGRASVGGKVGGGGGGGGGGGDGGRDGKQQQQQQSQQALLQQQRQRQRHKSLGDLEAGRQGRLTPSAGAGGGTSNGGAAAAGRQQQQQPARTTAMTATATATTRAHRNGGRRENGHNTPTIQAAQTTTTNHQQQNHNQEQSQRQQHSHEHHQHHQHHQHQHQQQQYQQKVANATAAAAAAIDAGQLTQAHLHELVEMRETEQRMHSMEEYLDTKYEQVMQMMWAEEDRWQQEQLLQQEDEEEEEREQQQQQQQQSVQSQSVEAAATSAKRCPPIGVLLEALQSDPAVQRWSQFSFNVRPEMLAPWTVASG